ncbi:glutathione S-transferase family protein [Polaromonas jejuensis]|uniref:glutathione transferase n=1 Tax=Polaromonas jejuensis TaxID=457502 RepID=A0ABW0Q3D3_9BURK|nr:glutathione S-transferase family protein [Polaromonas jejuensis]
MKLTLISHTLCPYVQRAAIVLAEKEAAFERRNIDLANKPAWFKAVSPLGKTPVLMVDGDAIFESAVICEYLDDTLLPRLHPADALKRAQHRAWMEFGTTLLNTLGGFYNAPDAASLESRRRELRARFAQIEPVLPRQGTYFSGDAFSLVDAVFGPVFRYFDVFEQAGEHGIFEHTPKVRAWRAALAQRASIQRAVRSDYADELRQFLLKRGSELSRRMSASVRTQA